MIIYDLTPMFLDGMAIRQDHSTDSYRVPESSGPNAIKYGEHARGALIYTVQKTGEATDAIAGDEWLYITSPRVGWVAIKHHGVPLSIVKQIEDPNPPDPSPEEEFISATLTRKDGSKVEFDLIKKTP